MLHTYNLIFLIPYFVTECNEIISVLPYTEISASSHKNSRRKKSCMPDMGDLNSSKGWCPRKQNGNYYLAFIRMHIYPKFPVNKG